MRIPLINLREWSSIAPLLPPAHGPGKPRSDDRLVLSAFFYSEATRCSLESLPPAYGNPRPLRIRRQRWERDGTLTRLMEAGAPVVERMRRGYLGLIRGATLDWKNSSEFFGKGVDPEIAPCRASRPLCRSTAVDAQTKIRNRTIR
jgi:transposase